MNLSFLSLVNFRNYTEQSIDFNSRLTFITGPNAYGKTNIIEAISMIALGKSFRGATDYDLTRNGSEFYAIRTKYKRNDSQYQIDFSCDISKKQIQRKVFINRKQISGRSELIGNLVCVIFSPSDISIVEGGPQQRRRFIDVAISAFDRDYLNNLIQYNRALKQRNMVLKKIRQKAVTESELSVWDEPISNFGKKIIESRLKFLNSFNHIFNESLQRISGSADLIDLKYHFINEKEESNFKECLQSNINRDLAVGFTTIGPQRHNLGFEHQGKDITRFGSQGQKRSLVLALRVAEFYYLKEKLKLSPILLIDDVIRELDVSRRKAFTELLYECGQAIFTTPDLAGLEDFINNMEKESEIFRLEKEGQLVLNSGITPDIKA